MSKFYFPRGHHTLPRFGPTEFPQVVEYDRYTADCVTLETRQSYFGIHAMRTNILQSKFGRIFLSRPDASFQTARFLIFGHEFSQMALLDVNVLFGFFLFWGGENQGFSRQFFTFVLIPCPQSTAPDDKMTLPSDA